MEIELQPPRASNSIADQAIGRLSRNPLCSGCAVPGRLLRPCASCYARRLDVARGLYHVRYAPVAGPFRRATTLRGRRARPSRGLRTRRLTLGQRAQSGSSRRPGSPAHASRCSTTRPSAPKRSSDVPATVSSLPSIGDHAPPVDRRTVARDDRLAEAALRLGLIREGPAAYSRGACRSRNGCE